VSAVTLDLWHTLLYVGPDDEERYMEAQIRIAEEALAAGAVLPGRAPVPDDALGNIFEKVYAEAVDAAADGRTISPREQIEIAAERAGRRLDVPAYLRALRDEVLHLKFRRAPGAPELLKGLRADGYRIAVISNTVGEPGEYLRPILRDMGFDDSVEHYVFSDELPWAKPAPEIFQLALREIGSDPSSAVHVGDGWSDIEGARRAGYRASILFTGLHEYGERYRALFASFGHRVIAPDRRAERLEEVGPIIRELLPPGGP